MNLADTLSKILPGNKTFLAAAGLLLAAWWAYLGKDYATALAFLSQALAAVGLRVAVTPPTPPTPPTVPPVAPPVAPPTTPLFPTP